jgi:hypothetical protein
MHLVHVAAKKLILFLNPLYKSLWSNHTCLLLLWIDLRTIPQDITLASGKKSSKGQVKASKETSIENQQALLLQEHNKKQNATRPWPEWWYYPNLTILCTKCFFFHICWNIQDFNHQLNCTLNSSKTKQWYRGLSTLALPLVPRCKEERKAYLCKQFWQTSKKIVLCLPNCLVLTRVLQ